MLTPSDMDEEEKWEHIQHYFIPSTNLIYDAKIFTENMALFVKAMTAWPAEAYETVNSLIFHTRTDMAMLLRYSPALDSLCESQPNSPPTEFLE